MYYNTNNESGVDLTDSWVAAANQDEIIFQLFRANPNESFTPDEMQHMCSILNKIWPITSIRRSLNTLTKSSKLTKTDELRKGKYNKKVHTWRLSND